MIEGFYKGSLKPFFSTKFPFPFFHMDFKKTLQTCHQIRVKNIFKKTALKKKKNIKQKQNKQTKKTMLTSQCHPEHAYCGCADIRNMLGLLSRLKCYASQMFWCVISV